MIWTVVFLCLLASADDGMSMMNMVDMNPASMFLTNQSSGTAMNPADWNMPMLMKPFGRWNTSIMAQAFLVDTQQSKGAGAKLYSANWMMASAEHKVGENGALQFTAMLSLDPATITNRRYPLLFQTGETAFGKPIRDGQHPHDFVMGLSVQYALTINKDTTLQLYFAPVGDPALGPVAYPHRASAMELPQATLSHHWQDSTHIANEVVTAAIAYKKVKWEASGFYGSEPNESRWNIDYGPVNSWSTRAWFFPNGHWAVQASVGRIAKPEALEAGDQIRATASAHYTRGDWSSSLIWGRDHSTSTKRNLNAYLWESVWAVRKKNWITGRIESVKKDELSVAGVYRIGAFTAGYTRDIPFLRNLQAGIGANLTAYSTPAGLKAYYGDHPMGGNVYVRFRIRPE